MQVFSAFFKIAHKRITAISIYFIIYVAITLIFSFSASDEMTSKFKSKSLTISITDEDHSVASTALTTYLSSLHEVTETPADKEAVSDQLYYRTLDYVLIIPAGFEKKLIAQEKENLFQDIKIPGSANGYFVDQQVSKYTSTLQLYLAGGNSLETAIRKTDTSIEKLTPVSSVSFHDTKNDISSRIFYLYQYLPYIFIVMLFTGLSPILVIFSKDTLHSRMSCSAYPLAKRNFYLSLASIAYSLISWVLFIILGLIVYGKDMFSHLSLLCMVNSLAFLFIAVALALLISFFAPDDNAVNILANILGLSMSFLCGVFVPQYMLSDGVLSVGKFLPAYWYIKANNMLAGFSSETFSMNTYYQCIGIQLLFAVAIFAIAICLSKLKSKGR